jgi:superfamily II DNA/RNA helicase
MHVTKTFRDLGVDGALCDALATEGITHPFPIQELTLPLALIGSDLIGQARTGTGKTLAFGLPLLQRLDPARPVTQALVIVPTRELCLQVFDDLKIGAARGLTSVAVYGGVGYDEQIEALTTGVHVVVGTPGRLLDHLDRRNLDLSNVTQLVLDEADEMLDMGFLADVERLVEACQGEKRQTMLFSATMPTAIVKLARRYMDHPTFTRADTEAHETAPNVTQHFLQVHRMDKPRVLARILQSPGRGGVYVFVRTKHMADRLVNELEELRIPAIPIHGDLRQTAREKNLDRFREGKATVLVATEVAARGLDVTGVTHVVNYDCPDDEKMYLHRIGRTARAGEAGVAVTFAEFNEVDKLNVIRKAVGAANAQVEQVFSTSEVLTELFDLPDEKPWAHLSKRSTSERPSSGGARRETSAGRSESASRKSESGSGRRTPRTDGRPKSERRSEGSGADHDAGRGRSARRDATPEPAARRDASPERAAPDDLAPSAPSDAEAVRGTERGTERRSERGQRERTRTRRAEGGSERAAATPTEAEAAEAAERPASRTRSSRRGGRSTTDRAASERTTSAPDVPSDEAPARQRARGGQARTRARTAEAAGGHSEADEPRERSTRTGPERGGSGRGGSGRGATGRESGGRAGTGRGGTGRTGTESGGSGRGGRRERGERIPTAAPSEEVKLEQRGPEARGEGQPQLARRVKVEHLP